MSLRRCAVVVLAVGLAEAVFVFAPADGPVNVAPLAAVLVNGTTGRLNPDADLTFASAEAVTDGLSDSQHMFELPADAAGRQNLELRWPRPLVIAEVTILGWGDQRQCVVHVEAIGPAEGRQLLYTGIWDGQRSIPPLVSISGPILASALHLSFEGADRVLLNTVSVFVDAPRGVGWAWFLGLNVVGPWTIAATTVLSIFGFGRIAGRVVALPEPVPAERLVVGLTLAVVFASGWIVLPRHAAILFGWLAPTAMAATVELVCRFRTRHLVPGDDGPRLLLLLFVPVLLLAVVGVDSYVLTDRRVNPLDHLISYLGAQRLAAGSAMPEEMALRPWLLHALFAPWEALLGRFSYYGYLGFMAGLNSLVLVAAFVFAERWQAGAGRTTAGVLVLMPILVCFHFLGQRPLAAGLGLLAVYWWTVVPAARLWWGGSAAALAIGVHPSALFLLPGAAVYFLFRRTRDSSTRSSWARESLRSLLAGLTIPLVAYALWILFVRHRFPDAQNPLFYYPVMLRWYEPPPADRSIWEHLRTLSGEHWQALLLHRLGHLRHYLWTDDFSRLEPAVSWLRWISLPNVFGFVFTIGLLRREVWRVPVGFVWLAIVAPLLLHHLHIGQAHPQLHISPVPFFTVAMLLANQYGPMSDRFAKRVVMLAAAEWLLRLVAMVAPSWRAGGTWRAGSLESLGFFGRDEWSYRVLSLLPVLVWLVGAWLVLRGTLGRGPVEGGIIPTSRQS